MLPGRDFLRGGRVGSREDGHPAKRKHGEVVFDHDVPSITDAALD
jgi:hypothetical protein